MSKSDLVSIIISNYNGKEHLRECLLSLMRLKYSCYEVIVVDAASQDGSPEMVEREFPNVKLLRKGKIGIGEAINCGIMVAKGNLIVFDLNNDDVVDENWLGSLVEVIMSSPDIGIVCGKRFSYGKNRILDSAGGKINFFTGDTPVIGQNRVDSMEYDVQREVDYFGVILTKREVLENVGLCDPGYYIYHEDTDFCLRVKRAGYKVIYVPSAIFWHKGSSTVGKFSYSGYYYLSRSQIRFILKNFPVGFMFSALAYQLIIKTAIDSLLSIPVIWKLTIRMVPRFRLYIQGKSNPRLIIAKKDAVFWNLKNMRETIQERYKLAHAKDASSTTFVSR